MNGSQKSSLSTVDSEKLETLRELLTRLPPEEQLSIKVACKQIDAVLSSMEGNACIVLALVSAPYAGLQ